MRNKGIFTSNPTKIRQEGGQKEGAHDQRSGQAREPDHLPPVDTTTAPKREPHRKPLQPSKIKYILNFALFGLRKSRENTKAHQIKIHFCPILPRLSENLPR